VILPVSALARVVGSAALQSIRVSHARPALTANTRLVLPSECKGVALHSVFDWILSVSFHILMSISSAYAVGLAFSCNSVSFWWKETHSWVPNEPCSYKTVLEQYWLPPLPNSVRPAS
jgi:hypothetical protein